MSAPLRREEMRILLAVEIDTTGRGNPFLFQHARSLQTHPEIDSVQHGVGWLQVPELEPDVVHIHWPEALCQWHSPSHDRVAKIRESLQVLRRRAAIVVTVHNEYPHYKDTEGFRRLYSAVYEEADGLIHLGEASRHVVRRRYAKEISGAEETVIPLGNYSVFQNTVEAKAAREHLDLQPEDVVFLSFGRIRHQEELTLLRKSFHRARVPNKKLIIVSRLPNPSRIDWRKYLLRFPLWLDGSVTLVERYVVPDDVQLYLNSADVLVVVRKHALNSSNVALGFTFGKVVVGPSTGVVGELLEAAGNPTYDAHSQLSLAKALEHGYALSRGSIGESNQTLATETMSWSSIAEQHVQFFRSLLTRKRILDAG